MRESVAGGVDSSWTAEYGCGFGYLVPEMAIPLRRISCAAAVSTAGLGFLAFPSPLPWAWVHQGMVVLCAEA